MLADAQTRRQPARRPPRRAGELGPVAAQIALAGSIRGALIPVLLLSAAAAACGGPPGPCFLQGTPRWAPAGRLREDVCRRAGGVRPAKAAWQCAILDDERAAKTPLVIPQSKLWVEKFIVGLNLCPFAREPFKKDTIRYAISGASRALPGSR